MISREIECWGSVASRMENKLDDKDQWRNTKTQQGMQIDFVFSLIISPLSSFKLRISSATNRANMNVGKIWSSNSILGIWTPDEHNNFLKGIELYGNNWDKVGELVSAFNVLLI